MNPSLPVFLIFFSPKTIFVYITVVFGGLFYINVTATGFQNEITLLEEFSDLNFENNWTSNIEENPFSTCGSIGKIFGGYGLFGSSVDLRRTYFLKNIPHYSLEYSFDFIKIDEWDLEDRVSIYLDGAEYGPIRLEALESKEECGYTTSSGNSAEYLKRYTFTLPSHMEKFLNVSIKSHLNGASTKKSWGIKNINIRLRTCHPSCATCNGGTSTDCIECYENAGFKNEHSKECVCRDNFFLKFSADDWVNSCSSSQPCASCEMCHHSCNMCEGQSESSCFNCFLPDTYSGGKCIYPKSNINF